MMRQRRSITSALYRATRKSNTLRVARGAASRLQDHIARKAAERDPESTWFWDHYEQAASEIVEFLARAGVSLNQKHVADVGCGDGFMALGVVNHGHPARLVGFDIVLTDTEHLLRRALAEGAASSLPPALSFVKSTPLRLPADDCEFDVVCTWSAFEHIADPLAVLREIRRVLKRDGALFLQLWPFYFSDRGSHLWEWFPEPFHHLRDSSEVIVDAMRQSSVGGQERSEYMINEFRSLNRITLGELQDALIGSGFDIVRFELLTQLVAVPAELARSFRLSDLGISGVKLLAVPRAESG